MDENARHATAHLGAAIRRRRKAFGKTLVNLAQETELTIGFLSQIERDISSPSLSSLLRIAGALKTNVEELLNVPQTYTEYLTSKTRPTYSLGFPSRLYEKLGPGFSGALFYPCIIHRQKGQSSETMCHEGEVLCYLISGRLEYHLGDDVFIMNPGDSIHHNTLKPHYSKVLEETVELWVSSTPFRGPGSVD